MRSPYGLCASAGRPKVYEFVFAFVLSSNTDLDLVLDWKKKTLVSEMRVTQREWASFPVHDNGLESVLD